MQDISLNLPRISGVLSQFQQALHQCTVLINDGRRVDSAESARLLSRRWSQLAGEAELAMMAVYHVAGEYQPEHLTGADKWFALKGPRGLVPAELDKFLVDLRRLCALPPGLANERVVGPLRVLHRFQEGDAIEEDVFQRLSACLSAAADLGGAGSPVSTSPQSSESPTSLPPPTPTSAALHTPELARDLDPGIVLRGWSDILEALGITNRGPSAHRVIRRANTDCEGPIVNVRRRPEVLRSKLILWWNDIERRAELERESQESESAAIAELAERHGARQQDLGYHEKRRPNASGSM